MRVAMASTHLNHTTLPCVHGGLGLKTKEVGLALYELKAKDLCVALDELWRLK